MTIPEDRVARLRRLGLVPTAQRQAVLECLAELPSHPTAEEIHCVLRERFPTISKATVYNALEALKRVGAVLELTIAREAAHYDGHTEPHPHFLCRACGTLLDVDLPCSIRPGDDLLGHAVESVQVYLFGLCADCRSEERSG